MGGEGDDRGWDGWMASLTQWTWVWVNSGGWWWTGRPSMLQSMGRKEPDTTERLNKTELNWMILFARLSTVYILQFFIFTRVLGGRFCHSPISGKKTDICFSVLITNIWKVLSLWDNFTPSHWITMTPWISIQDNFRSHPPNLHTICICIGISFLLSSIGLSRDLFYR